MTADAGLSLLLDPARLSAVVGAPVRATRIRPKPGVSHVAALVGARDGAAHGWVRTLVGEARVKAGKVRARLEEAGLLGHLGELTLDDDTLLMWGPWWTDPRLVHHLARLRLGPDAEVLRHNPLRRLVVRDGAVVHRVTAHGHRDRLTRLVGGLARAGLGVVEPLPPRCRSRHITTWPYVEGRDASGPGMPERALREVGRALARLHAIDPAAVPDLGRRGWPETRAAAVAAVDQLAQVSAGPGQSGLDPDLALAAGSLADRLPLAMAEGPDVVCHGDFSLDQCLVDPAGRVLLTDFDRATLGPAVLDLASLRATTLLERSGAWEIVRAGHDAPPGPWVAAAVLARVAEPWRGQTSGWEEETRRRLALVDALIGVPREVTDGDDSLVVDRAWSKAPGAEDTRKVTVEGRDGQGRLRAATWTPQGRARLLPHGEDPALPALAEVAGGGELVVHRAGRRAVVRLTGAYAKVVRPGRAPALAAASRAGGRLAAEVGLLAPAVISCTEDVLVCDIVPGVPLHDLAGNPGWDDAWRTWAAAWGRLQRVEADLPVHASADEAAVLRDWSARAHWLLAGTAWPQRLEETAVALEAPGTGRLVPSHRDLHDKQLLWDGHQLSVLDLDTVALADPALDPANLAVHASLRKAQGLWSAADADVVRARCLEVGAEAGVEPQRWRLAERATIARLVAVYSFRPRYRELVLEWAEAAWGGAEGPGPGLALGTSLIGLSSLSPSGAAS